MLATDVRKIVLAHVQNDFTKSALIKMWATVSLAKSKMRSLLTGNALQNGRRVVVFQFFVFLERVLVNVDFPTDAAAVLTRIGNAFEVFVIGRRVEFHSVSFCA